VARLLLGPVLRHVGERDATVWVETDLSCEVTVEAGRRKGRAKTFTVAGHHYALVVVEGLEPATATPYEVSLDDTRVWPEPDSSFPPSRIRTVDPSGTIKVLFGSCREPPSVRPFDKALDPDIFDAYARRMAGRPDTAWPDLLLLVGDQVYADDTSRRMQDYIRTVRDIHRPPGKEVANFEEYTHLYYESWGEPAVRWLLSTLPTSMIFDDHDVRDDWNISHAWRRDMQRTDWWEERITGALMSYWVYQHIGNLSPAGLAEDELFADVQGATDAEAILRKFAQAADREADGAKGARWSYRRDFGPVRVVVVDSRCGRILEGDQRMMIGNDEFEWVERQAAESGYEHLVVVSSMPWLLPRALHDIESWNEALCAGTRGRTLARLAETVRRAVDLEHWAAFRRSFDRLAAWFERIARGEHGGPVPATISVLSGDVHHTYVSEADFGERYPTRVYQVTCSPIHNTIPTPMRMVFKLGWSRTAERLLRLLDRWARVPPLKMHWHHPTGPHFGNMLAQLEFDGRDARIVLERAVAKPRSIDLDIEEKLEITTKLSLTGSPRPD
jgi:phosphodiesterase/alkaline phosphatase D-like protein